MEGFLDTQVSLEPTPVSWSVSWSHFRISNLRSEMVDQIKKNSKNKVHLFSALLLHYFCTTFARKVVEVIRNVAEVMRNAAEVMRKIAEVMRRIAEVMCKIAEVKCKVAEVMYFKSAFF